MKEKLEQFGQLLDVMDVVENVDCVFAVNDTEDETNVMKKTPLLLHKHKQNTHPNHTQVGGWGLWPMIVP